MGDRWIPPYEGVERLEYPAGYGIRREGLSMAEIIIVSDTSLGWPLTRAYLYRV